MAVANLVEASRTFCSHNLAKGVKEALVVDPLLSHRINRLVIEPKDRAYTTSHWVEVGARHTVW
jgi:hypothetical protein